MSPEKIAELLLEIGAVTVDVCTPFEYASGLVSPIYTDCRLLMSHPAERSAIVEAMLEQVRALNTEVDVVVGAGTPGAWLAADLSKRFRVPMAYIRASSKDHGTRKKIEGGEILSSRNALLVADIVSTEKDIPEAVQAIESAGAKLICCSAIFTNNIGTIEATLREHSIPLATLTDVQTLLTVAQSRGDILPEDRARIEGWLRDPQKWQSPAQKPVGKRLNEYKDEVAHILLRIGAVTFTAAAPYRFSSGLLSPMYLDSRRIISFPTEWERTLSCFENLIVDQIGVRNMDVISGVAMGGIPHATRLASRFEVPMVYVKSSAEEHGKRSRIEGRVETGDRVIVIDDVVTTGGSIISAVTALRDAGATITHCLAIFTYEMDEARQMAEKAGLSLVSLTNLTSLLNVALARRMISEGQADAVTAWRKNPWDWGRTLRVDELN